MRTKAAELLDVLSQRKETVSFCESLTAGLAAAELAAVPGASAVLRGGLVTYSTSVKAHFTGLSVSQLEAQGVVSAPTALAMAQAALRECSSTWAVSLTGVAGPDMQENKPVGTVYVGIAHCSGRQQAYAVEGLPGMRNEIRAAAVEAAFGFLGQSIEEWGE